MRAWVPLLLLLPLAGCMDEGPQDHSSELVTISLLADGPFQVGVPLLVASDGASMSEWLDAFRITGNATIGVVDLGRGPVLWVSGNETVGLGAHLELAPSEGPAEAYLDADWSSQGTPDGGPLFWLQEGIVDLVFGYEGTSQRCFLSVHYTRVGMGPGWNAADETGFPGRSVQCT